MSLAIVPAEPEPLDDDEQQEEQDLRDKYNFENDETITDFTDEDPIQHNVYPDWEGNENEAEDLPEAPSEDIRRGYGNLFVGQTFFTAAGFMEAVLDHALKEGRNLKRVRWDTNKCAFDCMGGNCSWRIYCSVRKGSVMWEVKIYNGKHSCVPNGECEMLKVPVIARLFVDKIRNEPEYFLPQKIEELIKEKWKITV